MTEQELDELTQGDMKSVSHMLSESDRLGLQTEVVYTFANLLISGEIDIRRACYSALYEWDL